MVFGIQFGGGGYNLDSPGDEQRLLSLSIVHKMSLVFRVARAIEACFFTFKWE